ncbi:MAG TPA: SLC13 family permease [Phycisphaerales bacterium]|nr:SLC13 family permease [Phycisphaerales bacterium]
MNTDLLLVLGLLVSAIVMFAINRPRMDAVGLLMIVALPLTGVISMSEALAGFADSNIVLIAALFVIGEGLVRTGVARRLGDLLIAKAGKSQTRLMALLMVAVCGLGSMMSSTAVTAIFIPVALRIAQNTGSAPNRLMMPLSMAALISGMTTLVATAPNLVVNGELMRQGHKGFHFFAFSPFGIPVLILAIVYMCFARRMLPDGAGAGSGASSREPSLADWIEQYGLAAREHRLCVRANSPVVGKTLAEVDLRATSGANIVAVERPSRLSSRLIRPSRDTVLQSGDVLLIDLLAPCPSIEPLCAKLGLEVLPLAGAYFSDRSQDIGMAEVIVPADSGLVGRTILEARFRTRTGLTVIGVRHGREATGADLAREVLHIGDTLLVIGSWQDIERLRTDDAGVSILRMAADAKDILPMPGKALHAVGCLLLVVALMVTGALPNVQAALIGCLLMGLLGVIDLPSAYRSIDWKTLVLIVGMLPFSIALQRTGGVEIAADALMSVTSNAGAHVVLACLFFVTMSLGLFISNTATAVLMAPVALAVANDLGASPYPLAMTVALAASTAFVTPVSSPVNTLVVTPGNYKFGDFVKVGGPFAIIVMIVCVFLVPVLMPLYPT